MSLDIWLVENGETVFDCNITHNLNTMALHAGIYYYLWRPEEFRAYRAIDLICPLRCGLAILRNYPDYFKQFNPPNGWGDYDGFVFTVEHYLKACMDYPNAVIHVDR